MFAKRQTGSCFFIFRQNRFLFLCFFYILYIFLFVCLEFQIIRFMITTFITSTFFIDLLRFTYAGVMGCSAAEATGLGFVCFVVINPLMLSAADRVDFWLFLFHWHFLRFTPPPSDAVPPPPQPVTPVSLFTAKLNKEPSSILHRFAGGGGGDL